MSDERTCQTCRWWDNSHHGADAERNPVIHQETIGYGFCGRIQIITEKDPLAYVYKDGYCEGTIDVLATKPEFGCVQHEPLT